MTTGLERSVYEWTLSGVVLTSLMFIDQRKKELELLESELKKGIIEYLQESHSSLYADVSDYLKPNFKDDGGEYLLHWMSNHNKILNIVPIALIIEQGKDCYDSILKTIDINIRDGDF